jgi:hypothetical protein
MTTIPAIQRLVAVGSQAHRFEIPAQTQECPTYSTIQTNNMFRFTMPHDADVMKPIAAFIRTLDPPPPLDRLLDDLGTLKIATSGGEEFVNIPIKLLVATTGVDLTYEGCDLTIPLNLDMYFPAVPIIRLPFSSITYTIQTLSSTAATSVSFMTQNDYYDTDRRREMARNQWLFCPVQYIKTQTLVDPAHTNIYIFQLQMRTLMKGFFLEGRVQDISGVEVRLENNTQVLRYNQQELRIVGQAVREDYVFIPFRRGAAYSDPRTESYVGSLYDEGLVSVKMTYHAPRYSSTIHALLGNKVGYLGGMCGLQFVIRPDLIPITPDVVSQILGNFSSDPQPTWTTAVRTLNPERNTCPITYEPIAGDFCECDQCHHAFDATTFQNYAASRNPISCPTCRTPWTAFTIYQQPDA